MSLKKMGQAAIGLLLTGLAGQAVAQSIILFEDSNYRGREVRITGDVRNLDSVRFNDRTSSFRIVSGQWELCQHDDYRGTCEIHSSDQASMGRMNDQLTSLRPVAPGRPGRPGGGYQGPSLTFFSGPNYTGRSVVVTTSTPDFSRIGFNDQARSVRHSGRGSWVACQHANFDGACMVIDGDIPNIGGGMGGEISSAEPDYAGRPSRPGWGGGNAPRSGVFLFDGTNFDGQRVAVDSDISNLSRMGFNDRADSLIVARGETWIICDDEGFTDSCQRVQGEVRDLSSLGLRNRVTSLRRVDDSWGGSGGGYPGGGWDGGGHRRSVTLFTDPDFYGRRVEIDRDVRNLREYQFNDAAMSIRIPRGQRWEVCEDSDFRGRCQVLDDDVRNLSFIRLSRSLSSMRRVDNDFGGHPGGGYPGGGWNRGGEIILYDGFGQTGRSVRIENEITNLQRLGFNDQAQSLEVRGHGRWLVCQDSDFRGRCEEVSGDVNNLRGMNRQISSVRRLDH